MSWPLVERPGWLRLRAFKPIQPGNLLKAGNTLTQRLMGDLSRTTRGCAASLCLRL